MLQKVLKTTEDFVSRTVERRIREYSDIDEVKLSIEKEKMDYISEIRNIRQYVEWAENVDGERVTEEHVNTLTVLYQLKKELKKKMKANSAKK